MWNLTNPDEFLKGGTPHVTEHGPYTWLEKRPKINITNNGNGTNSYYNLKSYYFDRELSVGDETDMFTTINAAVFVVAHLLRNQPEGKKRLWNRFHVASGAQPILKTSVGGLLFGYEEPYLKHAQDILGENIIPTSSFGIFRLFNNSHDGLWTTFTGETDLNKMNTIEWWNNKKELSQWKTPLARKINGTDGTCFHPFVEKDEELFVFIPIACRPVPAYYSKTTRYFGNPLYDFRPAEWTFHYGPDVPWNDGFCTPDADHCPPNGVLNGSECIFGAPIYPSNPHFLYAEPLLRHMVSGMRPNEEQHSQSALVDPLTGVSFVGHVRAQVNVKTDKNDFIDGMESIPETYFPIFWQNETARVPTHEAKLVFWAVRFPLILLATTAIICLVIGFSLIVAFWVLLWKVKHSNVNGDLSKSLEPIEMTGHAGENSAYMTENEEKSDNLHI